MFPVFSDSPMFKDSTSLVLVSTQGMFAPQQCPAKAARSWKQSERWSTSASPSSLPPMRSSFACPVLSL